jgi:hypothetical protein
MGGGRVGCARPVQPKGTRTASPALEAASAPARLAQASDFCLSQLEPSMSLILSWVLFPLVLLVLGAGWGAIVERLSGVTLDGALLLPVGLASALVLAGTLTAFDWSAQAAVPLVGVGALAGLIFAWPGWRVGRWAALAAIGVVFVYGAPVLLSGGATFTGFVRLDDTATWFNVIDHVMSHGHSVAGQAPSTYSLVYTGDVGPTYPLGAFMLPGLGRGLSGIDAAWIFQPYLACCAAAVSLCLYAISGPLVSSPRIRALISFAGASSALLYGYSLWGGIKELTAAFLLVLMAALCIELLQRRPERARALIPFALTCGALIQTLGVGAGGWVAPALMLLTLVWIRRGRHSGELRVSVVSMARLAALIALLIVPVWLVLGEFLSKDAGLFSTGQSTATRIGNLNHPLSVFQLAGIWPVGDFRLSAPTISSAVLIGLVVLAAVGGMLTGALRRKFGVLLYVALALFGCAIVYLSGATPWVSGKTLAFSSPALLFAGLTGAGMLWAAWPKRRIVGGAGALVMLALLGGVLWSDALGYHDATLAPRARLAELQHIGKLVAGKGPTLLNEYEVYADRHFLRQGAPTEPAEYRNATLPLSNGTYLTKSAWADLDSFPLSTLEPYRSLVTRRSPAESRPPSIYRLIWQGRYYQLWQRPLKPSRVILQHVALGESSSLPYCGDAENGVQRPLCSADPVAVLSCPQIHNLAHTALERHARLLAYQRPAPIVARGDQTLWPAGWLHDEDSRTLTPTSPGVDVAHIAVAHSERYGLWLDGSFARGFEVSVDGHHLGSVTDELSSFASYFLLASVDLSAGVHTFALAYPHAGLSPGSGDHEFTSLSAITLQPQSPRSAMIEVSASESKRLCGRPLDWIELVTGS